MMGVHANCFSHVQLFVILWALDHQAPLFMEFSKQEYWSGLLCLPPGDFPGLEIELVSAWISCTVGR